MFSNSRPHSVSIAEVHNIKNLEDLLSNLDNLKKEISVIVEYNETVFALEKNQHRHNQILTDIAACTKRVFECIERGCESDDAQTLETDFIKCRNEYDELLKFFKKFETLDKHKKRKIQEQKDIESQFCVIIENRRRSNSIPNRNSQKFPSDPLKTVATEAAIDVNPAASFNHVLNQQTGLMHSAKWFKNRAGTMCNVAMDPESKSVQIPKIIHQIKLLSQKAKGLVDQSSPYFELLKDYSNEVESSILSLEEDNYSFKNVMHIQNKYKSLNMLLQDIIACTDITKYEKEIKFRKVILLDKIERLISKSTNKNYIDLVDVLSTLEKTVIDLNKNKNYKEYGKSQAESDKKILRELEKQFNKLNENFKTRSISQAATLNRKG